MFTVPANVQSHLAGNEHWPIRLYKIDNVTPLYYTESDTQVSWNGQTWSPKGITYSKAELKLGFEAASHTVSVDNIDDSMIAWALANDPTGYDISVYKGFSTGTKDGSGNLLLIDNWAGLLFVGRIISTSVADEMEFETRSEMDLHKQRGPRVSQHTLCRFQGQDGFKGPNCGYTGSETECNYTLTRCRELNNVARFGGFPDLSSKENS